MKQLLYKFIFFKVLGWKIVGSIDAKRKKMCNDCSTAYELV
jgi:hypothetical protein